MAPRWMPARNRVFPVANWSRVGTVAAEVCMCVAIDPYVPNKRKRVLSGSLFVSLAPNPGESGKTDGKLFCADVPKIYHCPLAVAFQYRAPTIPGMADVLPGFQVHYPTSISLVVSSVVVAVSATAAGC
jgi:hypothetical protein